MGNFEEEEKKFFPSSSSWSYTQKSLALFAQHDSTKKCLHCNDKRRKATSEYKIERIVSVGKQKRNVLLCKLLPKTESSIVLRSHLLRDAQRASNEIVDFEI